MNAAAHLSDTLRRANAFHQAGQLDAARSLYREILRLRPRHFDALHLLGVLAAQSNQPKQALRLLERALQVEPNSAAAHCNKGTALQATGQWGAALASYERAISLKPDHAIAHCNRAAVLKELGRRDEALLGYERALELRPELAEAHFSRGTLLQERGRLQDALASYDAAIALRATYAESHFQRSAVLKASGRCEEALASCERAIALRPDHAEAWCNRGYLLKQLGQWQQALVSLDRALTLRSDLVEARFNRATLLLSLGDFGRGWPAYESRWELKHCSAPKARGFPQDLWRGEAEIAGKTLLLHGEQGLGDTLQFCRYAPLVAQRGAKVLLEVQPSLVGLLSQLAHSCQVIEAGEALPRFDYHCPLLSLPLAFRTELDSIPSSAAYLGAAPGLMAQWQQRLGDARRPRVGLCWSGRAHHINDLQRSIPLTQLLEQLPRDFEYVSLQHEPRPHDRSTLEANPWVLDAGSGLRDFVDTAALCACMDLVVSVDTSVAHLSGALGKPTLILLPFAADWRWLLDRSDSPWYPSVRLLRQQIPGDWSAALKGLANALAQQFVAT
jgi:tetratricopeptide (TPR) repeat protein